MEDGYMLKANAVTTFVVVTAFLVFAGASSAADLHPIVEVQNGYLLGSIAEGKWSNAGETANLLTDQVTYRVYGLTQEFGEAKGGKPISADVPCEETLIVSLSPKPENGVIAIAAPWNALPRKPKMIDPDQKVYIDAVRDFLRTNG